MVTHFRVMAFFTVFTQAIGDLCRKWGRAAGFHVHPHQLRHSHATHAVQRGIDVFTLQATLGHSTSATTGHYVASNPRDTAQCVLIEEALILSIIIEVP